MPTPTLYAAKRPISPENNTKVPLLLMNKYKIRPIPKNLCYKSILVHENVILGREPLLAEKANI